MMSAIAVYTSSELCVLAFLEPNISSWIHMRHSGWNTTNSYPTNDAVTHENLCGSSLRPPSVCETCAAESICMCGRYFGLGAVSWRHCGPRRNMRTHSRALVRSSSLDEWTDPRNRFLSMSSSCEA